MKWQQTGLEHDDNPESNQGQAERERFLQIALDAMPIGISWARITDQKIVYMNRKFTEIFGYVLGDFEVISDWIRQYPDPAQRKWAQERWAQGPVDCAEHEIRVEPMELLIPAKDGTVKTILHSGVMVPSANLALATFIDISSRTENERVLEEARQGARESEARYRMLLEYSKEMISIASFDGSHRDVSPGVEEVVGWTPDEYLAKPIQELIHPDDFGEVIKTMREVQTGHEPKKFYRGRLLHKDGTYRWVEVQVRKYGKSFAGMPVGYVAIMRDVSEQKRQEDILVSEKRKLAEDAQHDELTGLANRRLFNASLRREVRRQSRETQALALLMIDIDRFKQYNDQYGHLQGDEALKQVAAALKKATKRDSDLVARFGGEEFVVLLPMTSSEGAAKLAAEILETVRSLAIPHLHSPSGVLTVSVGVSSCPEGAVADQDELLGQADVALYRAKNTGRNTYRVFEIEG